MQSEMVQPFGSKHSPLEVQKDLPHLKSKSASQRRETKTVIWDRQVQTHLVERQVQDPKAKKHQAVSEGLQQSGGEAQRHPCQAQQLHGCVSVQNQPWSQPQQGGGGEELLPKRLTTEAQLPTGRQQALVTIETSMEMEITNRQHVFLNSRLLLKT